MTVPIRIRAIAALLVFLLAVPAWAEIATSPDAAPGAASPADPTAISPPEDFELKPRTVAFVMGKGKWDDAEAIFETAFKSIYGAMMRQTIHPAGVPMVEYLDSDDSTFSFKAMVPVDARSGVSLGPDVQLGDGPSGKVLKFVHHGSFDDLEQVYNRIDDYLVSKDLSMVRVVEEYVTDQRLTPVNEMVTNIYVFVQ
jgi:effector-binding domain-containing protein